MNPEPFRKSSTECFLKLSLELNFGDGDSWREHDILVRGQTAVKKNMFDSQGPGSTGFSWASKASGSGGWRGTPARLAQGPATTE